MALPCLKSALLSLGFVASIAGAAVEEGTTTVQDRLLAGHTTGGHEHEATKVPIEGAPDGFQLMVRQGHGSDGEDSLTFHVECPRNAWCAVGFNNAAELSMGGGGEGSDIFICADGEVKRYWVTSMTTPANGVAVAGSTCGHEGDETHFEFTRTLDASGDTEIEIDPGTLLYVIYAMGQEGTTALAYHGNGQNNRGGARIEFENFGIEAHNHGGNGDDGPGVSSAGTMALDAVVASGVATFILGLMR